MSSKRSKTSRTAAPLRDRLTRAVQIVGTVTSILLLTGVAAGLTIGRPALQRRAADLKQTDLRVQIFWPPLGGNGASIAAAAGLPNTWLDAANRERLEHLASSTLTRDPFDAASVRATQEAFMRTGWFAAPCRVRREPGGTVTIRGIWRIPAAVVRWDDRDRVVSGKGELLDATYSPDVSGLRVILGPQMDPPDLGEAWVGGDVQAGLSLLGYLRTMPGSSQIYAIDVSELISHKRLIIVTDRGNRIIWGGRPGEFNPGQARDEVKRDRLARSFRDFGRIDANQAKGDVSLASVY